MTYTLAEILANKFLIALALLSLASLPVFAVGYLRFGLPAANHAVVHRFFWIWLTLFVAEYWVLGPFSFIGWDTDGNLAAGAYNYLAHTAGRPTFAHAFTGGVDLDLFFPGRQYLQPELLLARFLPTWIWVLAHKAMVAAIGFWGALLLARTFLPGRPGLALAAALPFPISNLYQLNFSVEFGTGFAVIPLAVWAAALAPRGRWFWASALAVAIVVGCATPMKVFPALAVALVAVIIAVGCRDLLRTAAVFGLYLVAAILNWHEVIYGLLLTSPLTTRDLFFAAKAPWAGIVLGWDLLASMWSSTLQIILAIGVLAWLDRGRAVRLALALLWFLGSLALLEGLPWQRIGLDVLSRLNHAYNSIAVPTLAIVASAVLLAALDVKGKAVRHTAAGLAAIGMAMTVWVKLTNVGQWIWLGGQAELHSHGNLKNPPWRPDEDFRVITALDTPHPNVTAGFYGFDAFDGSSNLDPKAYGEFWFEIMRRAPDYHRASRTRIEWKYWDGSVYDIGAQARLDLLRIANVRFVFSGLPLKGDGLRLVEAPADGADRFTKVRPDFFPSLPSFLAARVHRLTDAGNLWVYELADAMPRVFAATGIDIVGEGIDPGTLANRVAEIAPQRVVVATRSVASRLGRAQPFTLRGWTKMAEGYDIEVDAPQGGILVINNNFMPFWTARSGDSTLDMHPVNFVHMAVALPPMAGTVAIRYHRPQVRDAIARRLGVGGGQ